MLQPPCHGSLFLMSTADFEPLIRRATTQDVREFLEFVQTTYGDGALFKSRARCHLAIRMRAGFTAKGDSTERSGWRWTGHAWSAPSRCRTPLPDGRADDPAGWTVDVMVHPDYRRKRLGISSTMRS